MPTYDFRDTVTGDVFEKFMSISSKEEYLKENPHIEQMLISAPAMVSTTTTSKQNRVPDGFKEVLSKVGHHHPNSKVGMEHGDKSIKAVKTREIVRKHVDKITKRVEGK